MRSIKLLLDIKSTNVTGNKTVKAGTILTLVNSFKNWNYYKSEIGESVLITDSDVGSYEVISNDSNCEYNQKRSFSLTFKKPVKSRNGFKVVEKHFNCWSNQLESAHSFKIRILSLHGIDPALVFLKDASF